MGMLRVFDPASEIRVDAEPAIMVFSSAGPQAGQEAERDVAHRTKRQWRRMPEDRLRVSEHAKAHNINFFRGTSGF